jgi:anti-anti-sigma regulatory factor
MTENSGQIFAYRDGDEIGFRVVGRVSCHNSPALREFAQREIASGANRIFVQLDECTHFDSTFLGTLLFLRKPACGHAAGHASGEHTSLKLVAPSPEALQVLKQMKAASLFEIADHPPASDDATHDDATHDWQPLACEEHHGGSTLFKQNVVEAHEELAQVPGPLGDCFKPLAEHLRRELHGPG